MAYDKIIPIRARLDHTVNYILDHAKTSLAATLDYIVDSAKNTLGQEVLETAINCQLETVFQDMLATKRRWDKTGGVQGYHLIHSFAPGEVTPLEAHELGVEFATRLLGDRYEAVVTMTIFTATSCSTLSPSWTEGNFKIRSETTSGIFEACPTPSARNEACP